MEDFFRYQLFFPDLENLALWHCGATVLDIGAGCGAHALALQDDGTSVTALEISPGACRVMRDRGVTRVVQGDIYQFAGEEYDTLLLLMNGVGLAGTLVNLPAFLTRLKSLLKPGGQILMDSCDVSYLYKQQELPQNRYYGELSYCYHYQGEISAPFHWLFVDQHTLGQKAVQVGLKFQVIFQEDNQFLARLSKL